ncbi:hypothetical protein S1OALGB6SA_529, partial [Olavius algarvensis spirochete endosymbiont]
GGRLGSAGQSTGMNPGSLKPGRRQEIRRSGIIRDLNRAAVLPVPSASKIRRASAGYGAYHPCRRDLPDAVVECICHIDI